MKKKLRASRNETAAVESTIQRFSEFQNSLVGDINNRIDHGRLYIHEYDYEKVYNPKKIEKCLDAIKQINFDLDELGDGIKCDSDFPVFKKARTKADKPNKPPSFHRKQ
mmetsp:Transcript_15904/g.24524  ORF Transcript_15904/g.24524 Transcript_15904/m.24524 type:complete len:109 (+) Transcript_15904:127-453(+)